MTSGLRVQVQPGLLRWARERAGKSVTTLAARFPHLEDWERGEVRPTLKQLEDFAKATHAPIGFLFLKEPPPAEQVPLPDFRTVGTRRVGPPSPDLLDTIYLCQQRQEWYRTYTRTAGEDPLAFVGSVRLGANVEATATALRHALGFDLAERQQIPTWTEALRRFIQQTDDMGILVMCSGVVLNNNQRKLDPDEFRGFAIADDLAPLVFINGADSKAAQMFTLAHELAHIWLGQSAVSDAQALAAPRHEVERWCNRVAAELLVPLAAIRDDFDRRATLRSEIDRLARRFKVSTLVVLRRIHDAGGITRQVLEGAYASELGRLGNLPPSSGGNFYLTVPVRVSRRFARALIASTAEGTTSFTEAFRMLGIRKTSALRELGHSLGVSL